MPTIAPCPILTAWAEPCGRWRATEEDGTKRDYATREEADRAGWTSLAPLYRLPDGREFDSGELPPGTVRDVSEFGYPTGADGLSLIIVCPDGHHWAVDGRASNCTMKDDNVHRCWVRHGDPRKTGGLHVDKNGHTCAAGAGSILTDHWHGFLHRGYLVENDGQIPGGPPQPGMNFATAPIVPRLPPTPDSRDPRRVGGWGS